MRNSAPTRAVERGLRSGYICLETRQQRAQVGLRRPPRLGGGGREETCVKHRLNFPALSLFAVLSHPFSNPSRGSQLSPDAWGVAGNPPSPAGALPHPFTTAAGHREGGRFPGNCAGGDRRALTRGALGPSGYPASIGSGNCSPETVQPPPLLAKQPGPEEKVEREEGSGSAAGPPLISPHPNPHPLSHPLPASRAAGPAPSSRGRWSGPSGRVPPGSPGSGVRCSWQCGGRGHRHSRRRGRLLITLRASPGSGSHGQSGTPARRGRRPACEVGASRARVATQ